jgi:hypothetical protein
MIKESDKVQELKTGGELASEQMDELAQEMLETDLKMDTTNSNTMQRDEPILSMQNLHLL